jgi:hypothetical protein
MGKMAGKYGWMFFLLVRAKPREWMEEWMGSGGCWDDYYYYGSFPKNSLLLAPVRFLVPKWRLGGFHLFL